MSLSHLRFPALAAFSAVLGAPLAAQPLEVSLKPIGSAASERPLPAGARPQFDVLVRHRGERAVGPVTLTVRADDLAAEQIEGWQSDGRGLKAAIRSIPPGPGIARSFRLHVESAPLEAVPARVAVQATAPGKTAASVSAEIRIADCAGAYRARLMSMRDNLAAPVRDAAAAMRARDPSLPARRLFPAAGKRGSELARAEILAARFAAARGADAQMGTEWFRYMIARWATELTAYAGQPANPGLCADNYYQVAGYRQGLLPITRHIGTTREAAAMMLSLLREQRGGKTSNIETIVDELLEAAAISPAQEGAGSLATLANAYAILKKGRKLGRPLAQQFSIAETAAWLAEADRRGQQLNAAIEQVLRRIAEAHKASCVCAF